MILLTRQHLAPADGHSSRTHTKRQPQRSARSSEAACKSHSVRAPQLITSKHIHSDGRASPKLTANKRKHRMARHPGKPTTLSNQAKHLKKKQRNGEAAWQTHDPSYRKQAKHMKRQRNGEAAGQTHDPNHRKQAKHRKRQRNGEAAGQTHHPNHRNA